MAAPHVQLRVKREGTGILLGEYRKMKAVVKPNRTPHERALEILFELLLYRQTDQMSPADAALIEAAALTHRGPHPQTLPAEPL